MVDVHVVGRRHRAQADHLHRHRDESRFFPRSEDAIDRCSSSPSPSHYRSKRSPPAARSPPNEVHRENPIPSACLGVFGLSQHTTERDLKGKCNELVCGMKNFSSRLDMFYKFGRVKDIQIVIDKKTNKSRGFGFVYFEEVDSAARVSVQRRAEKGLLIVVSLHRQRKH